MKPKIVILHCADTPDYPESHPHFDRFGAEDVDLWHKRRGWKGNGYQWVVRRTGEVEAGRGEDEVGAHTEGVNNGSIGICWIGEKHFTDQQIDSLVNLFQEIKKRHGIDWHDWKGHYEFKRSKDCPGVSMNLFRRFLKGVV